MLSFFMWGRIIALNLITMLLEPSSEVIYSATSMPLYAEFERNGSIFCVLGVCCGTTGGAGGVDDPVLQYAVVPGRDPHFYELTPVPTDSAPPPHAGDGPCCV